MRRQAVYEVAFSVVSHHRNEAGQSVSFRSEFHDVRGGDASDGHPFGQCGAGPFERGDAGEGDGQARREQS